MTMPEHETYTAADEAMAASAETAFEAFTAAAPLGWRVELIDEEIYVTPPANGDHESILAEIVRETTIHAKDQALRMFTGVGLRLWGKDPGGRVIPDLVVAPKDSFRTFDEYHDPGPVVLVAEITSKSTGDKDRSVKLDAYARARIPHYLLVDREAETATLHSEPARNKYSRQVSVAFSEKLFLPEPLGFELDTALF
ncbi:Uma2 family endonuclease [Streptomyces millisiae]|uniref:Uma2 family endonuclease n=1 Tax=Streptomyces millisiae TaxID=3075542 RepID=A0ABU2M0I1_9ACTN|nr:Uma2 family endonuclease [Streptomyces sp. DSM 44918]MDT0322902.1 Uma2 family endonuclease [Streptomyces sp. DSM 44918]